MTTLAKTLIVTVALLPVLAGCGPTESEDLFVFEIDYLNEDVFDLMEIVFQASENAYVTDFVDPADVAEEPTADNRFTVVYDLPEKDRFGLGIGSGDVYLSVAEDGIPLASPLDFSFATTDALRVEVIYDLRYFGETAFGRSTDISFVVTLTARRTTREAAWSVEYFVEGDCFIGAALCEISTRFRAPGRPRDGLEAGFGDAEGFIDDPDVVDVWELDLDFGDIGFRAQGDVGCCAYYDEDFLYREFF